MPSILDLLRQRQAGPQPASVGATTQVQGLMQAKSGKAPVGGVAPISNIGEQVANQNAAAQQAQVEQQANITAAGQTQQALGQERQATSQRAGILQESAQKKDELAADQAKHDAYQQVFKEELASQKTRQRIDQQAQKDQWTNQFKFEDALQGDIFGQTRSNLFKDMGMANALAADQRQWEQWMTSIKGGDMIELAQLEMSAAGKKAQYEGAGAAAGAGAQIYDKSGKSKTSETTTNPRERVPLESTSSSTTGGARNPRAI